MELVKTKNEAFEEFGEVKEITTPIPRSYAIHCDLSSAATTVERTSGGRSSGASSSSNMSGASKK